jgi:16S rRNA (uracil1498-N3)-methyltransferase
MNLPRFFSPVPLATGDRVVLSEGAARHAVKVLRLKPGDGLALFDGLGGEYAARIVACVRGEVSVDLEVSRDRECESPLDVSLVQALQAGEKMDFTVQKAVELGVTRIVPVVSRRSVVRLEGERAVRRVAHWRAVAASACEQCGRNRVPEIGEMESLGQWLGKPVDDQPLRRLMLEPGASLSLGDLPAPARQMRIELLIGAEGGLAPDEVELALQAGFVGVRLGPRILRTETAGLAALAAFQCLWGDFLGEGKHV